MQNPPKSPPKNSPKNPANPAAAQNHAAKDSAQDSTKDSPQDSAANAPANAPATQNTQHQYRPNVAAVILSNRYPDVCEIFIAKRCDIKKKGNVWQFPQGGIDEGESPVEALFRELKEEIGTDCVEILAAYPRWLRYDFPAGVMAKKMYPYRGQRQKYFLVKIKDPALINLETEIPEFNCYKFVPFDEVFSHIVYFKRPIYRKVLGYFRKEGFI